MEIKTALEILKTAILLEKRGKAFYETVASKTDDPDVKNIFTIMAKEEQLHIEFLSKHYLQYEKTGSFDNTVSLVKADESIADMILDKNITKGISAAGFEAAAISAAIDMENRAIEVYSKRAQASTNFTEKQFYQFLADWEKEHHKILHALNEDLKERIWNDNQFWPF
ncbi:MAG: ferritin family protein [Bacteroidales bacterium]|nr:ferritin family protein [Bacteroidales bacterium]MDZ4203448.1 ferritin family protein [Bacteroidales bacterium]